MTIVLSDLNDAFRAAGDERPPDGTYAAKVLCSELGLSKAGNRHVRTELEFRNPKTGVPVIVQKYHGLEKDWLHYLRKDFHKLGVMIDSIENLPVVLCSLKGWVIEIEFQEAGEWYTIDLIRAISRPC